MSTREDILGRLRASLGRTADNAVSGRAGIEAYLAARKQGPQPDLQGDLLARFREKSKQLSSTVGEVAALSDVPLAIARYLADKRLPGQAVCWPEFIGLDWHAAQLDVVARAVGGDDLVGITGCFCAIAETGTLMLCSGPTTPAALSLLPETHIAIVQATRIVGVMEDGWQLVRGKSGAGPADWPRAINCISGPSRTGDIEQTIVLGAHGPYRVHILLVTGA
jgi:L-lactate dehydrogenase complex protein LldG